MEPRLYFVVLIPCGRFSCIPVSFWAHDVYYIVSYLSNDDCLDDCAILYTAIVHSDMDIHMSFPCVYLLRFCAFWVFCLGPVLLWSGWIFVFRRFLVCLLLAALSMVVSICAIACRDTLVRLVISLPTFTLLSLPLCLECYNRPLRLVG